MRVIIVILMIIFVGLQYKLWFGDGSIFQWRQSEKKIVAQTIENTQFLERNRGIEADIVELKSGDQALEEHARYGLGMVKNDETYYQFIE